MTSAPNSHNRTGSSSGDEPVFIMVGQFRRPHGIKGELRTTPSPEYPDAISPGLTLYAGQRYQPYTIQSVRWHGGDLLVKLEELPDRTAVEIFRNVMLYMKEEDLPELPEGEFYSHQLVGLQVITDEGTELGHLKEILVTGANDVLVVESPEGKELLLPDIKQVVLEVNHDAGTILVHLIPGLLGD